MPKCKARSKGRHGGRLSACLGLSSPQFNYHISLICFDSLFNHFNSLLSPPNLSTTYNHSQFLLTHCFLTSNWNATFLPTVSQNIRLLAPTNWVSCHPYLLHWKGTNIPNMQSSEQGTEMEVTLCFSRSSISAIQLSHLSHRFRSPFSNFSSLSCPPNLPTTKSRLLFNLHFYSREALTFGLRWRMIQSSNKPWLEPQLEV